MSDILVVTPVMRDHNGRGQVFVQSLRSHLELQCDDALDWYYVIGGDNMGSASETVTRKYNDARDVFLAGKWTHMLTIEADMIIPKDTITRLMAAEAHIAYGLYVFRHTGQVKWCSALEIERLKWKSFSDEPDHARAQWDTIAPVSGVGLGCTLISREVLEAHPFHYWKGVNCDWALACDAVEQGYTQRCDLGLICGHQSYTPSPRTLWPDINEPSLVRTEFPE